MTLATVKWPFTKGIQSADSDRAVDQDGKLADALNVHVKPTDANVLKIRPRFKYNHDTADQRARITKVGDGVVATGYDTIASTATDGSYVDLSQKPLRWGVKSTEKFAFTKDADIQCVAYAQQSNGDSIIVITSGDGSGTYTITCQLVASGVRYPEGVIASGIVAPARVYAIPKASGSGFTVLAPSSSVGAALYSSASNSVVPALVTNLTGDVMFDAVSAYISGTIAFLYTTGTALTLRVIDESFGTTIDGPFTVYDWSAAHPTETVPLLAGFANLNSSNGFHIWHMYDDDHELYCHLTRLTGATSLVYKSTGNPLSLTSPKVMTVGGGRIPVDSSLTIDAASYCYIGGGGTATPKISKLFLANESGLIEETFTSPIVPMARLWTDSTFFGCRLWGTMQAVSGIWELIVTSTTEDSEVIAWPLCYHTVNNALADSASVIDSGSGYRGYSAYFGSYTSKGMLRNRDSGAFSVVELSFDDETSGTGTGNGTVDIMLGAVPRYWDGVAMVPCGIPQGPVIDSIFSSGGGSLAAGEYAYAVVFEWIDARGNRQQSQAAIQRVTSAAGDQVDIEINTASVPADERTTGGKRGIRAVVYRSNPGEDILLRVIGLEKQFNRSSNLFTSFNYIISDDGSYSLDFEVLYTSPGGANELPATAIEETFLCRAYGERFIYVSRSFPSQLNFTKTLKQGRAIEPNQLLNFVMQQDATGLAVEDGNVYWFTRDNCFSFVPQFADDTGNDAGAVDSVPLCPGIGCTQPASVVETAVGVFFISDRGVHRIPRGGGTPEFVGADVEVVFSEFPVCAASAFSHTTSEVIFALNDDDGTKCCFLVYNIVVGQWFRWIPGGDGTGSPAAEKILSMAVSRDGTLHANLSVGGVASLVKMLDDGTAYDDLVTGGGTQINVCVNVTTKDVSSFGGPAEQGRYDRVAVECYGETGSALLFSESYDGGTTWMPEISIGTDSDADPPIYRLATQRTNKFRLRMRTTDNGDPSPASQLLAPTVLAGMTIYGYKLGRATSGRQRG